MKWKDFVDYWPSGKECAFVAMLTLAGAAIAAIGCSQQPVKPQTAVVQTQPGKAKSTVRETFYNGHSILHFKWDDGFSSGCIHNPDCPACKGKR